MSEENFASKSQLKSLIEDMASKIKVPVIKTTAAAPIGTIIAYMGVTAPRDYLVCDGTVYNITDYPELAGFFKEQFDSENYFGGDGTTTFAVPDLQGEFLRGTGTNSHADQGSGANVGVHQDGTTIPWIATNTAGTAINVRKVNTTAGSTPGNLDKEINSTKNWATTSSSYASAASSASAAERYTTRPTNTSVLFCIKYCSGAGQVPDETVSYKTARWLRFDPLNKRGFVIKKGTSIRKANGSFLTCSVDTAFQLTNGAALTEGTDYYIHLKNDGSFTASTDSTETSDVVIGRFHTLCVSAGTLTMILPESPSSGITTSDKVLVKPYNQKDDPDFYEFYNKQVTAVSAGTPYDVITCEHPLSGFVACDILPESIFCCSFEPHTRFDDAMVYDRDSDLFVDVYLQSGTGSNTRSKYNETHTVSRQQVNHLRDMKAVGKRLLSDEEFFSIALGSNECTAIQGASDKITVGGHVDTADRRMISAIGCEECCGYLGQWLNDISPVGGSGWNGYDGRNSFGQTYGTIPYGQLAGGDWGGSSACGSGSRTGNNPRSNVAASFGARGTIMRK